MREPLGSSGVGSASEASSPTLRPHFLFCPPGSTALGTPRTSTFASNVVPDNNNAVVCNAVGHSDDRKWTITAEDFACTAQWSANAFSGSTRSALALALRSSSGSECHDGASADC